MIEERKAESKYQMEITRENLGLIYDPLTSLSSVLSKS